jgi:hypothetical protein
MSEYYPWATTHLQPDESTDNFVGFVWWRTVEVELPTRAEACSDGTSDHTISYSGCLLRVRGTKEQSEGHTKQSSRFETIFANPNSASLTLWEYSQTAIIRFATGRAVSFFNE